jgi:hypothetical protein
VEFIALNDDNGADDALVVDSVQHMLTVVLVADLFDVEPIGVARDIVAVRVRADRGNATGKPWRMPRMKAGRLL